MTIEEIEQTINSFNLLISNTTKYQMLEDADDIACAIINYFNATNKFTCDQKEIIIDTLCMDYMDNFNETNKPKNITEAKNKFRNDITFAAEVTAEYIDRYFYEELVINNFNNLFLNYSDESYTNETNIAHIIYIIMTNSSYFTIEEQEIVLNYLVKETQDDIKRREKYGEEPDYSDNLICILSNEDIDTALYTIAQDKNLLIQLINYYFEAYILDDFQLIKIDNICALIMTDYIKGPTIKHLQKIYDSIIELDECYNYKETILNIIATVREYNKDSSEYNDESLEFDYSMCSTDYDYDLFIFNDNYGISIVKQYAEETMIEVELINKMIRNSLESQISSQDTIDENVAHLQNYFSKPNKQNEDNNHNNSFGEMSIEEVIQYQKICLISDYYNRFSNNPLSLAMNFHMSIIKNMSREYILNYFDVDQCFAKFCMESFTEETLNVNYEEHGVCNDEATLKKINPFYALEKISNKVYQKKK